MYVCVVVRRDDHPGGVPTYRANRFNDEESKDQIEVGIVCVCPRLEGSNAPQSSDALCPLVVWRSPPCVVAGLGIMMK